MPAASRVAPVTGAGGTPAQSLQPVNAHFPYFDTLLDNHSTPRRVWMERSFSAAISRGLTAPDCRISSMMGRTSAAHLEARSERSWVLALHPPCGKYAPALGGHLATAQNGSPRLDYDKGDSGGLRLCPSRTGTDPDREGLTRRLP
jgi:hypothetical protein